MSAIFELRPANEHDLERILCIAAGVPGAPRWTEGMYRSYLERSGAPAQQAALWVADRAGEVVAFAAALCVAGDAELDTLVVDVEVRRLGLGTTLVRAALGWAASAGASRLVLEVRASNLAARMLYEGLGFSVAGRRTAYYRHPDEDAVVMQVELRGADAGS